MAKHIRSAPERNPPGPRPNAIEPSRKTTAQRPDGEVEHRAAGSKLDERMYDKSLKPSEIIALQKKVIEDQESIIETLKGALAAAGVEAPSADAQAWLSGLTRQESALVGALFRCYPRPVDKYDLLDSLPGYDSVEERQVQLVAVNVHHLRKKLGADAVESVRGVGYRLSSRLHETIRGRRTTAQNVAMRRSKPELRLAA